MLAQVDKRGEFDEFGKFDAASALGTAMSLATGYADPVVQSQAATSGSTLRL